MTSDDRGAYRAWGLAEGEYAVRVNLPVARGPAANALDEMRRLTAGDVDRVVAATRGAGAGRGSNTSVQPAAPAELIACPTFYPSAMNAGDSTTVTLGPSEEREGVDVTVQQVATARIDGRVQVLNGALPQIVAVTLAPSGVQVPISGGTPVTNPTARMDRDGKFTFLAVGPGNYSLTARSGPPAARSERTSAPAWWALTELAVEGRDLEVAMDLQPPMNRGPDGLRRRIGSAQGLSGIRCSLMPRAPVISTLVCRARSTIRASLRSRASSRASIGRCS